MRQAKDLRIQENGNGKEVLEQRLLWANVEFKMENGKTRARTQHFLKTCVRDTGLFTSLVGALQRLEGGKKRSVFIDPSSELSSVRLHGGDCYWNGKSVEPLVHWFQELARHPVEPEKMHDAVFPIEGEELLVMHEELECYAKSDRKVLKREQKKRISKAAHRCKEKKCEVPKILKQIWLSGDKKENYINQNYLRNTKNFINHVKDSRQWKILIYADDMEAARKSIDLFQRSAITFNKIELKSYEAHVRENFNEDLAAELLYAKEKETMGEARNLPGAADIARVAVLYAKTEEDAGGVYMDMDAEIVGDLPRFYAPCGVQAAVDAEIGGGVSDTNQLLMSAGTLGNEFLEKALRRMLVPFSKDPGEINLDKLIRYEADRGLLEELRGRCNADARLLEKMFAGNQDAYLVDQMNYDPDVRFRLTLLKGNQLVPVLVEAFGENVFKGLPYSAAFLGPCRRIAVHADYAGNWRFGVIGASESTERRSEVVVGNEGILKTA